MLYDILKDFKGSQDGRFAESFEAGTQAELSDYLIACLPPGVARPAGEDDEGDETETTDGVVIKRGRGRPRKNP
jgi:hypothetical protein